MENGTEPYNLRVSDSDTCQIRALSQSYCCCNGSPAYTSQHSSTTVCRSRVRTHPLLPSIAPSQRFQVTFLHLHPSQDCLYCQLADIRRPLLARSSVRLSHPSRSSPINDERERERGGGPKGLRRMAFLVVKQRCSNTILEASSYIDGGPDRSRRTNFPRALVSRRRLPPSVGRSFGAFCSLAPRPASLKALDDSLKRTPHPVLHVGERA